MASEPKSTKAMLDAALARVQPRHVFLVVLDKVEDAFKDAPVSQGRDFSLRMIAEIRVINDREWTTERQDKIVEQSTARYDAFVTDAIGIVGQDKWKALEADVHGGLSDIESLLRRAHTDWLEVEKSTEWTLLRARVTDAALKLVNHPAAMNAAESVKAEVVDGLKKDPLGVFGSTATLASMSEAAVLWASSHISAGAAWASKDDDDSLRALVKYKGNAKAPVTVSEVVLKAADALPIVRNKIAKAKADVDAGAAVKFHQHAVAQCLDALTVQRLDEWSATALRSLESEKKSATALLTLLREKKWEQALKQLKSAVISLCLQFLPHAQMPPIEGVKDGFAYTANKLDLSNFSVHPDNVRFTTQSTFGSVKRGDPFLRVVVDDVSTVMRNIAWSFKQENFPYLTGQGECDADVRGVCIVLGFQVVRRPRRKCAPTSDEAAVSEEGSDNKKKPASATPASGGAAAAAAAAAPPPASADKKPNKAGAADDDVDDDEKETDCLPQIVLGVSRVHIDSVKIELKNMSFGTMMADMFSATIRTYMCSLMEDELLDKMGVVLDKINAQIYEHWDAVTATVDVRTMELPTETRAGKRALALETPITARKDVYSVTFAQEGPLGIVLGRSNEFVIVRGFKRAADGSMFPGEASGKIKIGDMLCGLNGAEVTSLPLDRVTARLARARRPLTLSFSAGAGDAVAGQSGAKRNNIAIMTFNEPKLGLLIKERPFQDRAAVVTGFKPTAEGGEGPAQKAGVPVGWVLAAVNGQDLLKKTFKETMEVFASAPRPVELRFVRDPDFEVELSEPPSDLKIAFLSSAVVVTKFDHLVGPAQSQCGDKLVTGDYVCAIGGKDASLMRFEDVIGLVRTAPRPLEIRFAREGNANVCSAMFGPGPLGLVFYKSAKDSKCSFKTFQGIEGPAERTKLIFPGMVLLRVNGVEVTSVEQARELLAKAAVPAKLRFRDMDAYMEGKW